MSDCLCLKQNDAEHLALVDEIISLRAEIRTELANIIEVLEEIRDSEKMKN